MSGYWKGVIGVSRGGTDEWVQGGVGGWGRRRGVGGVTRTCSGDRFECCIRDGVMQECGEIMMCLGCCSDGEVRWDDEVAWSVFRECRCRGMGGRGRRTT